MPAQDNEKHVRTSDISDLTLTRTVHPARSVNNLFAGIPLNAVNAGLAANGWSNGHQDAYSSDSVDVDGPTGRRAAGSRCGG